MTRNKIGSGYFTENFHVNTEYSFAQFSFTFLRVKIRVWIKVQVGVRYEVIFRVTIWA